MWEYIHERVKMEAEYILQTGATVRACAAHFDVSKSTVHKDVTERLKDIDESLWEGVRKVLDKNLSERHIRGGIATKNKYIQAERKSEIFCDSNKSERNYNQPFCRKESRVHCNNCTNEIGCEKSESMSCSVCNKPCNKNFRAT